ncbi:MAG: hypothetical protein ABSB32_03975 [Thermodesulfobacteriota bacterium]|jgi:hypothetical protein
MKKIMTLAIAVAFLLGAGSALGATVGDWAQVTIQTDNGQSLPLYPKAACGPKKKVYTEAVKGDEYKIVVCNLLPRRVGLVIAVDGRNIISGTKSCLRNSERMYILGPYESGEYRGWRTGSDRVNRFYFTDAADSYAAAFGDKSAMGVIAVAVYPEKERYVPPAPSADISRERSGAATPQAPQAKRAPAESSMESAGTGFGRDEYSPSRLVAFEPERQAIETLLIKYEWRSTLCRMGIIPCEIPAPPANRLWQEEGYAPSPPRRG